MASVTLAGITKTYEDRGGKHVAVHPFDLAIADGEFVVLVGPSGCGKTTTLRMIAGLEAISEGELRIGERVVTDLPPKDRDVAMVFQNYALYPHMTAYENLAFALRLRGLPRDDIDRRVREAAGLLGLDALLERKPRQLSGGERQRVALGRALVRHPQVFLFDEPLSNLDAKLRVQMRREIARLHRELKATMIYVTHDQVEAMTLGERIVVLNAGRVQQVAAPRTLYEKPENTFVASFIGSPAMNLLRGELAGGPTPGFQAAGGAFTLALPPAWRARLAGRPEAEIVLGIRPEDVQLDGTESAAAGSTVRCRVDLVELLGGEALIHASRDGHEITARLAAGAVPHAGEEITLGIPAATIHLFDGATGQRLIANSQ
jgi:multiple sugar transport system ATP-binding protein